MDKQVKPIIIDAGDVYFRQGIKQPMQVIPESKKNPKWYFDNLMYCLSFYNAPVGNIGFPSAVDTDRRPASNNLAVYPVQKMLKMIMYYLGEQPNLNYNHLQENVSSSNLQAQWIKGQEVSEYINHFRGLILGRISNAWFTARNISRQAMSEKEEMRKMLIIKQTLKEELAEIAKMGVDFDPADGKELNFPEDVEEFMENDYSVKEKMAIIGGDLANGIWFTNDWASKSLQSFMKMTICGLSAWEHSVLNGKSIQTPIDPYQVIEDNRLDDDFGKHDMFRGYVANETAITILSQYPELMPYRDDIEKMASDSSLGKPYNATSNNIVWWNYGVNNRNTLTKVVVYFRGLRDLEKAKLPNKYGTEVIRKVNEGEESEYALSDMYKATLIGNKYLVGYGLVNNLVEDMTDKGLPEFPIIKFRPNTFFGTSVSEVARVYRIQDELDMLDYKIREMVGDAKGKVYIIDGGKYGGNVSPREFMENVSSMKIHVANDSGEVNEMKDRQKGVEMIDWTLDPNIAQLAALYRERRERMGKVLSTTDIAMGQQTRYIGLGTQQSSINQSTIGLAYLMDGFMDFLVKNMRYAVNQLKNVKTLKDQDEVEMLVSKFGMKVIKFTKDMSLSDLMIELNLNDAFDEEARKRMITLAQAAMQNQQITMLQYAKMETMRSWLEVQKSLEYDLKKNKLEAEQNQAMIQQQEQQMSAQQQEFQTAMLQMTKVAEQFTKLTLEDRKGLWAIRKEEAKAEGRQMELEQAPAMPESPQQQI